MLSGRRLYGAITAFYALSRVTLYLLGARFGADYGWQHFHDPDLLKDRLWETLLYTHAFTPFINFLVGVVLKISEQHSVAIYHGIYLTMGLLFVNSLGYLMVACGLSRPAILGVVALFSCTPAFIYFENFLHYEFLAAVLLPISAVLFHRALTTGSFQRWFWFFLCCALIAYVRTTFHLVWLVAMLLLAILFQVTRWRVILAAAVLPFALVLALYGKNQVLFGFFGTSSMLGFNLAFVSTRQLSASQLKKWTEQGKIHPVSSLSVYAPPNRYARWIDLGANTGVPVLDRQMRTNGQPNYNHWSYAEISKLRMKDNRYYFAHRKRRYLQTVSHGFTTYFLPTSRWHPLDGPEAHRKHNDERGPHYRNRLVIGTWEDRYNAALHSFPYKPFGLYTLLIPMLLYATFRALRNLFKARFADRLADKLVVLMAFNSAYVPVLSCMVTTVELQRYRFIVEAFMWIASLSLLGRQAAIARVAPVLNAARSRSAADSQDASACAPSSSAPHLLGRMPPG